MLDFDNDGRLDLYEANGRVGRQSDDVFRRSVRRAEPALPRRRGPAVRGGPPARRHVTQLLVGNSRAAAFGDIDNDGGLDIVVVNRDARPYLLRNVATSRGHWVMFRVLDAHGRDALGAELTMTVGSTPRPRDVRAAYSYLASNDPRVHVGLGAVTTVQNVTVTWPGGRRQSFGDFAPIRSCR